MEWIKKHNLTTCYLQETHFKYKSRNRLKMKEWEVGGVKGWTNMHHADTNEKKPQVVVLHDGRTSISHGPSCL